MNFLIMFVFSYYEARINRNTMSHLFSVADDGWLVSSASSFFSGVSGMGEASSNSFLAFSLVIQGNMCFILLKAPVTVMKLTYSKGNNNKIRAVS